MWTPEIYQRTLAFAGAAHRDQLVPGTEITYVVHLANVAMEIMLAGARGPAFDFDLAVQCALLHDTLEDTPIQAEQLEAEFGPTVTAGVKALTKNASLPKDQQMSDSLARIRQQPPEVWMVKLADRITNLQPPPHDWKREKCAAYRQEARRILAELGSAHPHLEGRLSLKIEQYAVYSESP